jgi:tetratricopeptide (TPR) repeat protein
MKFYENLDRLINLPSPRVLAATLAAAALVVIAGLLLLLGRRHWVGRVLTSLGLIVIMVTLFAVREQTITERQTAIVSSTRPRFSERTLRYANAGLLAVPTLSAVVVASVYLSFRRKRRAEVPRFLKAGRKHLVQKDFEAALLAYNQAIHIAPHLSEGYCRRASVYRAMGHPALALADLDRALVHDPRLAAAYLERGKIRTEVGDLDAALEDFGQLMKIRGNDPDTLLNRGICLMKKGLPHDAADDFRRVIKLTNHSDFAEPAKAFLRQCEPESAAAPITPGLNAAAPSPYSSKPTAQDYVV